MISDSIVIEGQKISYKKTGTGKPLVILHGWGSSARVMVPIAAQLEDIRTSWLIDFPGFGDSDEPAEPWDVGRYAQNTEECINQLLPDGPSFDLLVHSYGARVAIKLLTKHSISNRIDKVIFTGAAGLKPKRSVSFYIKKYTAKTLKLPFLLLPATPREKALNWLRKTSVWKKLGSSDYQQLSGVMRETFVKSVTEHLDSVVPEIEHEVLLLWGKNDMATPLEQAHRMESLLQNSALVVLEDCAHYAFLDKPKQFASIARAYLQPAANNSK